MASEQTKTTWLDDVRWWIGAAFVSFGGWMMGEKFDD